MLPRCMRVQVPNSAERLRHRSLFGRTGRFLHEATHKEVNIGRGEFHLCDATIMRPESNGGGGMLEQRILADTSSHRKRKSAPESWP
jgi:hypothetical protein